VPPLLKEKKLTDKEADPFLKPPPYVNASIEASDNLKYLHGSLFLLSVALVGLIAVVIYQYAFQTAKPYIVEVDELGRSFYAGEVGNLSPGKLDKFTPQYLLNLTDWWRSVTPDNVKKKSEIKKVVCMVDKSGGFYQDLSDYLSDEEKNPFILGENIIRSVDVKSILKSGERSWSAEWVETTRKHSGDVEGEPFRYKANILLGYGGPSDDLECKKVNPFGIYIKDISWARIK